MRCVAQRTRERVRGMGVAVMVSTWGGGLDLFCSFARCSTPNLRRSRVRRQNDLGLGFRTSGFSLLRQPQQSRGAAWRVPLAEPTGSSVASLTAHCREVESLGFYVYTGLIVIGSLNPEAWRRTCAARR